MLIVAASALCLLVAIGFSRPGRAALGRLLSVVSGSQPDEGMESPFSSGQGSGDFEQRARVRHGWSATVTNSVLRGTITFYNRNGEAKRQASLSLYRKYPDRLRLDLDSGSVVETLAFDQNTAWRTGEPNLSEEQERDIRAWLRLFPERLFMMRGAGAQYREAGRRVEDYRPAVPWADRTQPGAPVSLEQVEVMDTIDTQPSPGRVADRRKVFYYIDRGTATIHSVRWIEPDDPNRRQDDNAAPKTDMRVDFSDWRVVDGVLWPFEVIRWAGGRVAFRIQLAEVRMNQDTPDSLFQQHPAVR